jgi:amidase
MQQASPFVSYAGPGVATPPGGPLDGLTFAVKDLVDVAGMRTGAGSPAWLATHDPAPANAPVVDCLLDSGARLVGKTQTDELAFSLNGENHHYGTPLNPACPERVPGGSSSGSASAVAQGLVDFAIGTDTAGSVRVPSAYCGLWGIRPSFGAVSMAGIVPLAPPFDTVGWMSADPMLLDRVGRVLLPEDSRAWSPTRFVRSGDAFELADGETCQALEASLVDIAKLFGSGDTLNIAAEGDCLAHLAGQFRAMQGHAIWRTHGAWIEASRPEFGPGVGDRFRWAATVSAAEADRARDYQVSFRTRLAELLGSDGLIVLPTAPGPAPYLATPPKELEPFRNRLLTLTAIASFSGCPQVSLPVALCDGAPVGLSFIAPAGTDRVLLAFVASLAERLRWT